MSWKGSGREMSWPDLIYTYFRLIRIVTEFVVKVNMSFCTPQRLLSVWSYSSTHSSPWHYVELCLASRPRRFNLREGAPGTH
jgi:hypothetical protein